MTVAAVLVARGALSWENSGVAQLGAAVGMIAVAGILYRLRSSRHGHTGVRQSAAPVVISQDIQNVQNDARRHRRFVPVRRATTLHMRDGRQMAARIVDISIAGVAIEARLTDTDFLAVDRVGAHAAGPVRRTSTGAVFGFKTLLDPQPFDASFVL